MKTAEEIKEYLLKIVKEDNRPFSVHYFCVDLLKFIEDKPYDNK